MDDSREIIYLALSNLALQQKVILEEEKLTQEAKGLAEYIYNRSQELAEAFALKIIEEENKPIPKPNWNEQS